MLLLSRGEQLRGPLLLLKGSQLKLCPAAGGVLALRVSVGPPGVLPGEEGGGTLALDHNRWVAERSGGGHADGGGAPVDADRSGVLWHGRAPRGRIQNLVQVADLLQADVWLQLGEAQKKVGK